MEDVEAKLQEARERHTTAKDSEMLKAKLEAEYSELYTTRQQEKKNLLLDKLADIECEINPYTEQLKDLATRNQRLQSLYTQATEEANKLARDIEHLDFWTATFGKDFKTYLFNKACPFLQSRTAKHLFGLGNSQLKVEFSTTKELKSGEERSGFSTHVYSETGGTGFDSLSGGEQQMVSFAVGLALADLAETQVQGASHFLILDEPFMALDDRNCENLVNYLSNELTSKRETILLISNEDNIKSLIPSRIHVEKNGGITRLANG